MVEGYVAIGAGGDNVHANRMYGRRQAASGRLMGRKTPAVITLAGFVASVWMFFFASGPHGGPSRVDRVAYAVGLNDFAAVQMHLAAAREHLRHALDQGDSGWRRPVMEAQLDLDKAVVAADGHVGEGAVNRISDVRDSLANRSHRSIAERAHKEVVVLQEEMSG